MNTTVVGGQDISRSINIDETELHKRIVTVTISVVVPLYFMRILGFQNSTVSATGQATRRDANIMVVLDHSSSMNKTVRRLQTPIDIDRIANLAVIEVRRPCRLE
jgi:hypothetical protein